ncbi:MAG: carbohydrate ABC transporter permease [Anaerolineae bacterium]|nr:carbohydrate ABC transporter permease [Anaerolineae bacterium]
MTDTTYNGQFSPQTSGALFQPRRKPLTVRRVLLYAGLLILTLIWLLPFFSALLTSVRTMDEISLNGFWRPDLNTLTLENFTQAWEQARVSRYLGNSFVITLPSLFATLFLSSLSAFALARYKFRLALPLYFMFVAGTMLPFQILLLPVFKLANDWKVYNTHWALIIIHTAFQMGFCTMVLRNYMKTIPNDIVEAARVDGCSDFRIYWQIIIPLTLPAMAALATLEFTWIFNDYLWALILVQNDALKPITAGLASLQGQFTTNWPLITAGSLIGVVPTLFVFAFLQRYFIQGLTLGSGK